MPWRLKAPDWSRWIPSGGAPSRSSSGMSATRRFLATGWTSRAPRRRGSRIRRRRPAEVRTGSTKELSGRGASRSFPSGARKTLRGGGNAFTALPGEPPPSADPASALLQYWFELQKKWLAQRTSAPAQLEQTHASGGWVGPRAVIHPTATLTPLSGSAPGARIGAECKIGLERLCLARSDCR